MSVDLSILLRNDFTKTDDPQACKEYIHKTIAQLKKYFCAEDIIDEIRLEDDEMFFYIKPLDDVCVHLHKGCWEFETYHHYSKYFYNDEQNSNFLRRFAFDCARAFGKDEAWITDEYHGWASLLENVSDGFEDWLKSKSNVAGFPNEVLEYVPDSFSNEDVNNFHYSTKYHDSLEGEPRNRLAQLSALFPDFEILTTHHRENIILGRKEGRLYALDSAKEKLFVDYAIDGIVFHNNTVEIFKDGQSAMLNYDGTQLVGYGKHDFHWKYDDKKNTLRLIDDVTGQSWVIPLD